MNRHWNLVASATFSLPGLLTWRLSGWISCSYKIHYRKTRKNRADEYEGKKGETWKRTDDSV